MQVTRRTRSVLGLAAAGAASSLVAWIQPARGQQLPGDTIVYQSGDDGNTSTTSGLNTTTVWGGLNPSTGTGYAYVDTQYRIRTPSGAGTTGNVSVLGDSFTLLSINPSSVYTSSTDTNGGLGGLVPGADGSAAWLTLKGGGTNTTTFKNLVLANGGLVTNYANDNQTIAGNIYLVPAGTTIDGMTTTVSGGIIDTHGNNLTGATGTNENYFNVSSNISGGGSLRVENTGGGTSGSTFISQVVNLSGSNTFSGGVVLDGTSTVGVTGNGPDLAISSPTALGTGTLTIIPASWAGETPTSGAPGLTLDNLSGAAETLTTNNAQTWLGSFSYIGTPSLNMGSGAVTLGANVTLTVKNALSTLSVGSVNNSSTGSYGLTKAGAGTLILNGPILYSGQTTVSAGTLELTSTGDNFSGGISVASGATLALAVGGTSGLTVTDLSNLPTSGFSSGSLLGIDTTAGSLALANPLSGSFGLNKIGPNTLTLAGGDSFGGPVTVSGGTLKLGSNESLSSTYGTSISPAGTLDLYGNSLTVTTLTAAYNSSTPAILTNSATTPATVTVGASSVFNGNITASLGLTITAGTVSLGGSNSYTGPTTLSGGTLSFNASNSLPTATTVFFNGGTFQFSSNYTADPSAQFSNTSGQAFSLDTNGQNITLAKGLVSSGGSLNKLGTGTLTLAGSDAYAGATTITAGTLVLGSATAISPTAPVNFGSSSAATLDVGGFSPTVTGLSGTNTASIITNSGGNPSILTVVVPSGTVSYAGVISDGNRPVSLVFSGGGNQVLSGLSSFSGGTNISAGTVTAESSSALGSGKITLGGGTLALSAGSSLAVAVSGFTNFQVNKNSQSAASATGLVGSTLVLTDTNSSGSEATSAFTPTPITINPNGFVASFTYKPTPAAAQSFLADGFTFMLQNQGPTALGINGGGLGYSGISPSVAAAFNIFNYYTTQPGVAVGINGAPLNGNIGGSFTSTGNVSLDVGDPIQVTLTYTGSTQVLYEQLTDTTTGATYNQSFTGIVMPSSAYVGFTGSDGGNFAGQNISNFTFANDAVGPVSLANNVTTTPGTSSSIQLAVSQGYVAGAIGSLTINTGSKVTLSSTSADGVATHGLLTTTALSIAGSSNSWHGTLDLTNNSLDVQSGNLSAVTNMVKEGYASGTWQGPGGILSSAAASDTAHLTALGAIVNTIDGVNPLYGSGTALGLFSGISPGVNDVLVKYTYYGDTNLDGQVDGSDYSRIDAAYMNNQNGSNPQLTGWFNGDFNYDGVIDGSDYTLIDNAFNSQGASLSAIAAVSTAQISGPSGTAVPEPTTAVMLTTAALGLIGRRRRKLR